MDLNSFKVIESTQGLFVSDCVFELDTYERLVAEFPLSELRQKMGLTYFADMDSARSPEAIAQVVKHSKLWKLLIRQVTSKEFRSSLIRRFEAELIDVRGAESIKRLKASNTEVKVGFHLSRRGYLLSPHTDTGQKLITIILYLPPVHEALVKAAGTNFYSPIDVPTGEAFLEKLLSIDGKAPHAQHPRVFGVSLDRVYGKEDYSTDLNFKLKEFDALHRRSTHVSYQPNRALAFVKSNLSWHDVRLEDSPVEFLRRSFYINFTAKTGSSLSFGKGIVNRFKVV
jgi:hypothetical protein